MSILTRRSLCTLWLPVLAVLIGSALVARAADMSATEQRLLDDVKVLASDEYEGRGVGTEGLKKASAYVAHAFTEAGLDVTEEGGDPFQEFTITTGAELTEPNRLTIHVPGAESFDLPYGEAFVTCSFGAAGEFSGGLVFCGYGIESDDPAYNDFEGVDVKRKVVIIMRRTPQQSSPEGMFAVGHGMSRHAALTTKASEAFQRGAAAVLFVNDPYTDRSEHEELQHQLGEARQRLLAAAEALVDDDPKTGNREELDAAADHLEQVDALIAADDPDPLMEFGYGGTRSGRSLPILQITRNACNQILKPALGKTLDEIEQEIDETGKPASAELDGWTVSGQTSLRAVEVPVANVIGVLEGEGPRADETVVIGAHYDHLGLGGDGSLSPGSTEIHNGADDNASGTAVLMELARRFAARDKPLPRRLVFIAFSGEERGLLGSIYYVKHPLVPLDKTVAMINMDMVGRLQDDKLTVFGTGTSPFWGGILEAAAKPEHLELSLKPEGFGPSDHSSFYAREIPVLHLFTGTHSDYHRPGDDWDKINYEGMSRVTDFVQELVQDVAEAKERPVYVQVQGRASIERSGSRPYFGSIPDFSSDANGYAIQGVSPGSPADKAGVKGGDVIVELGGNKIGSLDDFDLALRKFSAGEDVEVVVRRKGEEVKLHVTLAQPH